MVCDLAFLATKYKDGFKVILEPYHSGSKTLDPLLQLCCLDPRIAMEKVQAKFKSIVLTSGTMAPIEIYPKILGLPPLVMKEHNMYLPRNSINPLIITKGKD